MIGYFILLHRFPEQFKRMFRAIYAPGNSYVIHVDKGSGAEFAADIAEFLKPYQGVAIIESKKALWGGYSLVDAELRGMGKLLAMSSSWTHYINLSGQDFPLKSQAYIRDFLRANPRRQYIRALDQRAIRPETLNRVSHMFVEALGRMFRTGVPRAFLKGATPFIGTQWKVVTRGFCQFAVHHPSAERFKTFYRRSFIPDEAFFQTLIMNSPNQGEVMNDDLRTIDWVPDGDIKLRPRTFVTADALRLTLSPDLFARKFDLGEDAVIFDLIEAHLKTLAAMDYVGDVVIKPSRPRAKPIEALTPN
ncbi:beta-1,6-N-acetylglucosaminyltransferase [Sphingopyxis sp.]|uniref:beta-1,6-N-acetylglucosaminyltransferase n=1 Tax=Sphingopyxis sp. TaxID=1908224 RepID=UPI003D099A1E